MFEMAKDPAFLFYDGDAARDVSHMNRLERGCYFDFIQAQKKFGWLSLDVIKKILGKDFETCWQSLKICLTYEQDMYFIMWLHESIEKRKKYSESRSRNKKGSNKPKNKDLDSTYVNHMENAIVNENAIEEVLKYGLDEIYLDQERMKWPKIDFDDEVETFRNKVRGSPQEYIGRDSAGIRLALQYQLRNAKQKSNGKAIGTKQQQTIATANAVLEQYGDILGKRPNE